MEARRRGSLTLVATVLAVAAAGCGGSGSSSAGAPTTPEASPAAVPASTDLGVPVAPAAVSSIPDGVYRTQIDDTLLRKHGYSDPGNAGTWTLTIRHGTYTLDCKSVATPGVDCGNTDPGLSSLVEVGTVHGTGHTVWMVHDMAKKVRLTHCVRYSQAADGCGPEGGFHMAWQVVPKGLSFSQYVGIGDEDGPPLANWVIQPWTKIS